MFLHVSVILSTRGRGVLQTPPGTAIAADGTHPTGMHSCSHCDGNSIITTRKRSLGQGNVFTCLSFCPQGGVSVQRVSVQRGLCLERYLSRPVSVREIPLYCKERAVRILLECILVFIIFVSSNVDVTNLYCGTTSRFSQGNGFLKPEISTVATSTKLCVSAV